MAKKYQTIHVFMKKIRKKQKHIKYFLKKSVPFWKRTEKQTKMQRKPSFFNVVEHNTLVLLGNR